MIDLFAVFHLPIHQIRFCARQHKVYRTESKFSIWENAILLAILCSAYTFSLNMCVCVCAQREAFSTNDDDDVVQPAKRITKTICR